MSSNIPTRRVLLHNGRPTRPLPFRRWRRDRLGGMPAEILYAIYDYMTFYEKASLMRVCKRLHVIGAKSLYSHLDLDTSDSARVCFTTMVGQKAVCGIVYAQFVQSIKFTVEKPYIPEDCASIVAFSAAITQMTHLRSLHLSLPNIIQVRNVIKWRLTPSIFRHQPTAFECVTAQDGRVFTPWSLPVLETLSLQHYTDLIPVITLRNITTIHIAAFLDGPQFSLLLESLKDANFKTPLRHIFLKIKKSVQLEDVVAGIGMCAPEVKTLYLVRSSCAYLATLRMLRDNPHCLPALQKFYINGKAATSPLDNIARGRGCANRLLEANNMHQELLTAVSESRRQFEVLGIGKLLWAKGGKYGEWSPIPDSLTIGWWVNRYKGHVTKIAKIMMEFWGPTSYAAKMVGVFQDA